MTTTPPRPRDTGAYRDDRHRKGGAWLWWLLGLLLLAAIVAVIVILLVVHHHNHKKTTAVVPVPTSATPTFAPTTAIPPTASASASAPASSAATATALVGGGGVAAKPATGSEAASGAVGTVLFAEASATIDANGERVITAAVTQLKASNATRVSVVGYTDFIAGQTVNAKLSEQRADAVAARLRTLLPGVTVTASAKGQANPVASNGSAAGRAQNRRATITGS